MPARRLSFAQHRRLVELRVPVAGWDARGRPVIEAPRTDVRAPDRFALKRDGDPTTPAEPVTAEEDR